MIYLDSSALLKLVHSERESYALAYWLAENDLPWVSSVLARVEVLRATRRINPEALPAAVHLMESVDSIPLSAEVIDRASTVGHEALRSPNALHLASALTIRQELRWFVTYDLRLTAAAELVDVAVISPGV